MNDPKRLSAGDDVGARLLKSALADEPPSGARNRLVAAAGLTVGAAALATAKTAGASVAPKAIAAATGAAAGGASGGAATGGAGALAVGAKIGGGIWIKIAIATAVSAAVVGSAATGVRMLHSSSAPAATATTSPPIEARPATPPAAVAATTESEPQPAEKPADVAPPTVQPATKAEPTPAPPVVRVTSRGAASSPANTPAETALARELRSLDAARSALRSGDVKTAIAELDAHDRRFPSGALSTESSMLRVEALLARGDTASARRLARTLLDRDPSGPHARRLRSIVDGAP